MGRFPAVLAACALVLVAAVTAVAPVAAADASTGPALETPPSKLAASLRCPERFTRPGEPVLLVHGTWATADANWGWNYVPGLEIVGLDVCLVDLPAKSTGDIQVAAEYVVHAVREMHARSGEKVDVLGHSQGGLQPRWALKWWPDVRAAVDDFVMLASPNHGTLWADLPTSTTGCMPSCRQMATTSQFQAVLNAGDETPGAVSYTSLYSLTDELVQPAAPEPTAALEGASNVLMQELCPGRPVEHAQFAADGAAFDVVLDAFTQPGPFDPARFDVAASCAKTGFEGVNPTGTLTDSGDYEFPVSETFRGGDEPPLKPYARGAGAEGESKGLGSPHSDPGADAVVRGAAERPETAGAPVSSERGPTPATGAPTTLLASAGAMLSAAGWGARRMLARRG